MSAVGQSAILAPSDFTQATAYAATMRLLAENPTVDAVFAACDVTAIGVLKALTETGRRVPDDVAVVGFDGSALADAADLTSVYSPVETEAAIAVRTLLDPLYRNRSTARHSPGRSLHHMTRVGVRFLQECAARAQTPS